MNKKLVYQVGNNRKLYYDARPTKYQDLNRCCIISAQTGHSFVLFNFIAPREVLVLVSLLLVLLPCRVETRCYKITTTKVVLTAFTC